MKTLLCSLLAVGLVVTGCGKKENKAVAKETNAPAATGNPITAPVDYLGAVAKAKKVSEKTIDMAYINQAIQQFNAMEERYPTDLREMVTKGYLRSVPEPPYGMRFIYDAKTGQFRVVRQEAAPAPAPVPAPVRR